MELQFSQLFDLFDPFWSIWCCLPCPRTTEALSFGSRSDTSSGWVGAHHHLGLHLQRPSASLHLTKIQQVKCGFHHLSLSENGGKTIPKDCHPFSNFGILFGIVRCWEEDLKDPYNLKSGIFVGAGIWEVFLCALIHDFQEVAWKTVTTFSSA